MFLTQSRRKTKEIKAEIDQVTTLPDFAEKVPCINALARERLKAKLGSPRVRDIKTAYSANLIVLMALFWRVIIFLSWGLRFRDQAWQP